MTEEKKRWTLRLPPCPAYDVAGMEQWLEESAERGLFLKKDGFWVGIGCFERDTPRSAVYRLQASQGSTSLFADNYGDPDPEAVEISEKFGWEYVAKRGGFHIYRSFSPQAREMDTDPEVQAFALNAMQKRQRATLFRMVFWGILYPALRIFPSFFIGILALHTWLFLFLTGVVIWHFADAIVEFISIRRLQKRIRAGDFSPQKPRRIPHYVLSLTKNVLIVVAVVLFLGRLGGILLEDEKISLADYTGDPPFATLEDFAEKGGKQEFSYQLTTFGIANTVMEWSDWLAPRNIQWEEIAEVTYADGSVLEGGLYVDYHETSSEWLAGQLAREYYRGDKYEPRKGFEPLGTPKVEADFAVAYIDTLHFPTVVLQKGKVVVHATFYQYDPEEALPMEAWVGYLAECLPE